LSILLQRIEAAKKDKTELDRLIADYMPFIKKTIHSAGDLGMEYDDRLSLAMLSFMTCITQYEPGRGGFTAYAAVCIRNRLVDESRRQARTSRKSIPFAAEGADQGNTDAMDRASVDLYSREAERKSLSDEIDALSEQLKQHNIRFEELPLICPKQKKARAQCIDIGRYAAGHKETRENLLVHRRLSQAALAKKFGLSEKTIEKHRKYIVTIALLLIGDYPLIRAFLPQYEG